MGDHGETYRIGGDEFQAIQLSFAYGHAICNLSQGQSVRDSERLADKEMYECKHRMKAERQ